MSTSAQSDDHVEAMYFAQQLVKHAPALSYDELARLIAELATALAEQGRISMCMEFGIDSDQSLGNSTTFVILPGADSTTTYSYRQILQQIQQLTLDEQLKMISHQAQQLTPEAQAELLAELAKIHSKRLAGQPEAKPKPKKNHDIMEDEGMAQHIWSKENVEEYIKEERASWDE